MYMRLNAGSEKRSKWNSQMRDMDGWMYIKDRQYSNIIKEEEEKNGERREN